MYSTTYELHPHGKPRDLDEIVELEKDLGVYVNISLSQLLVCQINKQGNAPGIITVVSACKL